MKKILICDCASAMETNYEPTINALKNSMGESFGEYEIKICPYENDAQLAEELKDAEGLITAFLEIGDSILNRAEKLKCISVSAVGYGNIDCEAAVRHGVTVCHIEEYCTEEVAEHTLALIGALNRNLKYYDRQVGEKKSWKYHTISGGRTLNHQTLAIFGFGRIGRRVAGLAKGFGMKVIAVDPYAKQEDAKAQGVKLVSAKQALEEADIITNHMNLTKENKYFFNEETFAIMSRKPIFINVGRGACVKESALVNALDSGIIRAAGLDVLEDEEPDLNACRLLNRDNVIITPHSAFYSDESIEALQRISGENLGCFLTGNKDRVFSVVPECR